MVTKTIVIRLSANILPPNPLGQARYARDALSNDANDHLTGKECSQEAEALYAANESLFSVVESSPELLGRLIAAIGRGQQETVFDVLQSAVHALPETEKAFEFFMRARRGEMLDDVLLEEYAAPTIEAIQIIGVSVVEDSDE